MNKLLNRTEAAQCGPASPLSLFPLSSVLLPVPQARNIRFQSPSSSHPYLHISYYLHLEIISWPLLLVNSDSLVQVECHWRRLPYISVTSQHKPSQHKVAWCWTHTHLSLSLLKAGTPTMACEFCKCLSHFQISPSTQDPTSMKTTGA